MDNSRNLIKDTENIHIEELKSKLKDAAIIIEELVNRNKILEFNVKDRNEE